MSTIVFRTSIYMLALCSLLLFFMILTNQSLPSLTFLNLSNLQSFKTMMISIILESFPFILLGVLLSSILQIFVSERAVARIIPKNPFLGILFACLVGILFPMCECGMIPVVRRLIAKGMPVYIAVVFITVGPILNPIVYASTYMAFRSKPQMAYSRMGLAFAVAVVIGVVIHRFVKSNPLRTLVETVQNNGDEPLHSHVHKHHNRFTAMLSHASEEFFEMGKYLMFGAMITAIIQTFVARSSLVSVGHGAISSHLFMIGLAYILSLCSTSDAFVASSFVNTFTTGSLLTFLVFGPMLDLKGTLMLLSVFKTKFVLLLSGLIFISVLFGSLVFERIFSL